MNKFRAVVHFVIFYYTDVYLRLSIRAVVLLRPKNFVRHFQGPDIKCKLPLSTNNLAFFIVIVILTICHSVHQFKFCEYKGQVLLLQNHHTTASGARGRLATIF
jgi:hypothetical protein